MGTSRQALHIDCLTAVFLVLGLYSTACPVASQNFPRPSESSARVAHAAAYADCMALAHRNPEKALDFTQSWERNGGDEGARHCRAVAVLNTGAYAKAAEQLETLAGTTSKTVNRLQGELYTQAGQAWLIAGKASRALAAQTRALALIGREPELLLDRAITHASTGEYWRAIDDLNDVIDQDPLHSGALVLRATAWRKLVNLDLALDDIQRAISMSSAGVDALLERGNIRLLRGDRVGAVSDWTSVIAAGPNSLAADAALKNLAKIK